MHCTGARYWLKTNLCQIALIRQNFHQGKLCIQTHLVGQNLQWRGRLHSGCQVMIFRWLVVQLRHASLIATTGAELVRNWLPKNYWWLEFYSGITASDKQGLAGFGFNQSKWPIYGSFGHMCSWLDDGNYYKRVTFLTCAMPCDFLKFGSIPALMPENKDLLDLASISPSDPGDWVMGTCVIMT